MQKGQMMSKPKVPNTISNKQMRGLQRRAQWATRNEKFTDKKAINRRLAMRENAKKSQWS
jgi:hypothetical protein